MDVIASCTALVAGSALKRPHPGDAHEKALKEAETDAMKRALATFGNRFGLCLHAKGQQRLAKRRSRTKPVAPSGC